MSESNCEPAAFEDYVTRYRKAEITGAELAELEKSGTISKTDRRKIVKTAAKAPKELTQRQKHRLEVKEKKSQPRKKLSYEERKEKYSDVDDKIKERYAEASTHVVCLGCRKRGHYLKDCPLAASGQFDGSGDGGARRYGSSSSAHMVPSASASASAIAATSSGNGGTGMSICFNCGSSDHALRACPVPRCEKGVLKYASCFVCKAMGHISRDCPNNLNGLYPQGGCCHICRQTTHLVKDCPQRTEEDKVEWLASIAAEKQRKEDAKLGPRIKGLVDTDITGGGGDDYAFGGNDNDNDDVSDGSDGEGGESSKKRKSSKPHKSKHSTEGKGSKRKKSKSH